jgi:hypothetical protein
MRNGLDAANLPTDGEHDILVNGHPATVLIGRRPAADRARQLSTEARNPAHVAN